MGEKTALSIMGIFTKFAYHQFNSRIKCSSNHSVRGYAELHLNRVIKMKNLFKIDFIQTRI